MISLPLDIIAAVARELCFHCQKPGHFPDADVEDTREDKRTLARLCRVSRDVCSVVRPVLYHYYATGNLAVKSGGRAAPDLLPQFMQTISARPDLADHVVTAQLIPTSTCFWLDARTKSSPPAFAHRVIPIREKYLATADAHKARSVAWHSWLYLLTALCPRLRAVLLDISQQEELHRDRFHSAHDVQFPSLRTLGLVTDAKGHAFADVGYFLQAAPNLDELYAHASAIKILCSKNFAAGRATRPAARDGPRESSSPPRSVKRLTIVGMKPARVRGLISQTPDLEWLECYSKTVHYAFSGCDFPADKGRLASTLRGLSLSTVPLIWEEAQVQEPQSLAGTIWEISDLTALEGLEHLSLSCRSLARCVSKNPRHTVVTNTTPEPGRGIASVLPRNLRTLRISWVDLNLLGPLQELAEATEAQLPRLEKVGVGISGRMVEEGLKHVAETMDAAPLFAARGITFGWTVDCLRPRLFEAGAAARAEGFPLDEFPLTLEGPGWRFCEGGGPDVVSWGEVVSLWELLWDKD